MQRCDIACLFIQSRRLRIPAFESGKPHARAELLSSVALREALRRGPRRDDRHRGIAVDEHELAVKVGIEAIERRLRPRAPRRTAREKVQEVRIDDVPGSPLALIEAVGLHVEDEFTVGWRQKITRRARSLGRNDVGSSWRRGIGKPPSPAQVGPTRPPSCGDAGADDDELLQPISLMTVIVTAIPIVLARKARRSIPWRRASLSARRRISSRIAASRGVCCAIVLAVRMVAQPNGWLDGQLGVGLLAKLEPRKFRHVCSCPSRFEPGFIAPDTGSWLRRSRAVTPEPWRRCPFPRRQSPSSRRPRNSNYSYPCSPY